jgi:hypothetical protein
VRKKSMRVLMRFLGRIWSKIVNYTFEAPLKTWVLSFDRLRMNGNLLFFITRVRTELVEVQFLEILF